jgi:hypothetical protein
VTPAYVDDLDWQSDSKMELGMNSCGADSY